MQHYDGTWSHKPGSLAVSNKSIDGSVYLNNSNIQNCANQGRYQNGGVRFFVITKDAVADHPHSFAANNALHLSTTLYDYEVAGDSPTPSASYVATQGYGRLDYSTDEDFFYYVPDYSGIQTVAVYALDGVSVDVVFQDLYGNVLFADSINSPYFYPVYLTAGNRYYFGIRSSYGVYSEYYFHIGS